MQQQIILKNIEPPLKPDVSEDINWLCKSLGFVSKRDKDETASKIFGIVVDAAVKKQRLTSNEIANKSDITRAAALHHIKNYISSGIIVEERTTYFLRMRSLQKTIEEVELDVQRIFNNLKKIAGEIDSKLGLQYR
jgi:predicted transcriptional regulator